MAILTTLRAKYAIKKYCNLIGAATIVAARTTSVYGCDQTLFTASAAKKLRARKRVGDARLEWDVVWCSYDERTNRLRVYRCLLTNRLHGKAAELYLANS